MTSQEQGKESAMKKPEEPAVPETTATDDPGTRIDQDGNRYSSTALDDPHHNKTVEKLEDTLKAAGVWATPGDQGEAPRVD